MFRLVSDRWEQEVLAARGASPNELRIVCPFIKAGAMQRILDAGRNRKIEVITRFDLGCFYEGVSDIEALRLLLDEGATVRGVKGLHAKLFLFDETTAIGTSANVTDAGMLRNHEFGFVSDDQDVMTACRDYFDALWKKARTDLKPKQLGEWDDMVATARRSSGEAKRPRLPDFGTRVNMASPLVGLSRNGAAYANRAFLKFFGRGSARTPRDLAISEMVAESGCNWACTYPTSARPRQVADGDILYMARIAAPDDLLIYGSAIGWRHRDDEDVASEAEIAERPWKSEYANYVRVHDARFVNAELGVGVSMYEMLSELGADSWRSTQDNARSGRGNTDPFASYFRKACQTAFKRDPRSASKRDPLFG